MENLITKNAKYVPVASTGTQNVKLFSGGTVTQNMSTQKVKNQIVFYNYPVQNMSHMWNKFEEIMKEFDESNSFRNIETLYSVDINEEVENLDGYIDELLASLKRFGFPTPTSHVAHNTRCRMPESGRNFEVPCGEMYIRRYNPNTQNTNYSTSVQRNQCDLMVSPSVVAPNMSAPVFNATKKVRHRPFYDQRNYFRRDCVKQA